jgi:cell wall-associated NlpC family hydrolase
MDKLSEASINQSPYIYSFNNPIRFVDPDGNHPWDVILAAMTKLGTWYEWGGKNADPSFLFSNKRIGTRVGYERRGDARLHKILYDEYGFMLRRQDAYNSLNVNVAPGNSFGLDCSGFAAHAFNADPDKLMPDFNPYEQGAAGQMQAFKDAEKLGTGYLHTNIRLLMGGDLVFNTKLEDGIETSGHVMVATGAIKLVNGKWEFQVMHANASGARAGFEWIPWESHHRIGHAKRTNELELQIWNISNRTSRGNGPTWDEVRSWITRNRLWSKVTIKQ